MTKTILVLHMAGRYPMAGFAFQALHYLIGLKRFGYDVYYLEDSYSPTYNPKLMSTVADSSYNATFLESVMGKFGFSDKWAYWDKFNNRCYGLSKEDVMKLYKKADAIFNICGSTRLREEHLQCPIRVYVETDPVTPQIELALGNEKTKEILSSHTHHFTYGQNLGNPDCPIPLEGFDWQKTCPPVVLDLWEYHFNSAAKKFTTISTWRNKKEGITFKEKEYYFTKHSNFLAIKEIPKLVSSKFELALSWKKGDEDSLRVMQESGWLIADAFEKSCDLDVYQNYIYESQGEFAAAKDNVIISNSGWFSDRSVCYLAAGRPVVLQETGFSKFIPTGNGLFSFKNIQEAKEAIDTINRDYEFHCREARKIAEKYFDSDKVIGKMLKHCGV